jgi:hypothetical protein
MADAWDDYIKNIQNGGQQPAAPAQPQQGGFLGMLLSNILKPAQGGGNVGVGGVPTPNKQGMYTPSLNMAAAGPSTPINYAAIKNLLNSGVMQTGKVPPQPLPMAPPAPPPPTPAPEAKKGPLDMLFSFLLG